MLYVTPEPDLFPLKDGIILTAEQLANDFETLQSLISDLKMSSSILAGPDVASLILWDFFRSKILKLVSYLLTKLFRFLSSLKPGIISAATWHQ